MKRSQSFRGSNLFSGLNELGLKQAVDLPFSISEGISHDLLYHPIASWGKLWLNYLGNHLNVARAGFALADESGNAIWMAGWPEDISPACEGRTMETSGMFSLISRDRTLGWLIVEGDSEYALDPETLETINRLLPILSDGLQRELEQTQLQQAEFAITHLLQSNLNTEESLPGVLDVLSGLFQADAVLMTSRFPSSERPNVLAVRGLDNGAAAKIGGISRAKTAVGILFDQRQPIWIEDLCTPPSTIQPLHRLDKFGFQTYLAVPVIGRNEATSALEFVWRERRPRAFHLEGFLMRVARQLALSMERSTLLHDLRHANQDILKSYNSVFESLTRILGLRDHETEAHTQRVSQLTMRLVQHIKLPSEQWGAIQRGALLHDIGKLGIPDAILLKPGSLTDAEYRMMQLHVTYGYSILSSITHARQTLDIVLYHHERWDGKGYPDGLRGEQIPEVARLFAVVDVYDALTSDRPYRTAWLHSQVVEYLKKEAGRQFDPRMVSAFLEVAGEDFDF